MYVAGFLLIPSAFALVLLLFVFNTRVISAVTGVAGILLLAVFVLDNADLGESTDAC